MRVDHRRVLRNQANYVSGWLLGYGLLLFVLALDPLGVVLTGGEDGSNGLDALNLQFFVFFGSISLIGFALWGRPRVELLPGLVVLRNILRDVRIPADAIESVDATGDYIKISAGGRRYTAAGLEQSNLMLLRGSDFSQRAAESIGAQVTGSVTTSGVTVSWRGLEWPEAVLLLLWAGYLAAAIIAAEG